jgi:hypothetical protein
MNENRPSQVAVRDENAPSSKRLEFLTDTGDTTVAATALAASPGSGSVPPVEWHGTRQECLVNVSAKAVLAWVRDPGQPMRLTLLLTTSGDIHNPFIVQSIEVPFSVGVLVDGIQYQSISHSLFAPAVLDPRGSDQWYTWRDEADNLNATDLADLSRITLQITI